MRAHKALPTLEPRGMLGSAPPFSSSSTAWVEEAGPVRRRQNCGALWREMRRVYQVVPGCYSERERRVSAPEQVCAGAVRQQQGHNFTGILEKTVLFCERNERQKRKRLHDCAVRRRIVNDGLTWWSLSLMQATCKAVRPPSFGLRFPPAFCRSWGFIKT